MVGAFGSSRANTFPSSGAQTGQAPGAVSHSQPSSTSRFRSYTAMAPLKLARWSSVRAINSACLRGVSPRERG